MKILVTGAAGFIGSHLAERLKSQNHDVVGLDCFTPYYSKELKELNAQDLKDQGIQILNIDLVDENSIGRLEEAVKDVEAVFHFAAQPGISASTPFEIYVRNNIWATENLLKAIQENAPQFELFVNIATSSIYGKNATDTEDAAPKPTSYYGVTKLAAEQLVLAKYRDENFPATSTRLFSVYGERERPEKLYPKLINSILNDKEFPLFEGSEHHLRSYTYVGDIIDGLVAMLQTKEKVLGEIFNLGLDTSTTTGEGIKIVEELLGKPANLAIKPKRPGDQLKTEANITKAREVLGYNPTTTPREGLAREVEWFKEKVWKKVSLYQ